MINRLFFASEFRGSNNRLNRDRYPHMYVLTVIVPGNIRWFAVVSFFASLEERRCYVTHTADIRNELDELRKQKQIDGTITNAVYKFRLEHEWIPTVDCFIEDWGIDMVPHDLRDYCDHVQEYILCMPKYRWPWNVDVPSETVAEVSLHTPRHNDELVIAGLATNDESTPE
jgi:hypothetical protein